MIARIERSEIPGYGGRGRSELRLFAKAAVEEFAATVPPGGFAEVTGWPAGKTAQQLVEALRTEAFSLGARGRMGFIRRGDRVFLEMREVSR